MLRIENLARRSQSELEAIVTERCSAFGQVSRATVYTAPAAGGARPFSIVAMATRAAAERMAAALGGRTVGNAVVIFLYEPALPALPAPQSAARETRGSVLALHAAGRQ